MFIEMIYKLVNLLCPNVTWIIASNQVTQVLVLGMRVMYVSTVMK